MVKFSRADFSIETIVNFSFITCIFLALGSIQLPFIDIYYYYIFVIVVFPIIFLRFLTIDKWLLIISVYLFILGIVNIFLGNNDIYSFLKVYVGYFIFFYFYYLIIKIKEYNLNSLFNIYYKFAIFHAYVGMIQLFSYAIGFKFGYDYTWLGLRVMAPSEIAGTVLYPINALTGEPAAFVFVQSAAMYLALVKIFKAKAPIIGSKLDAFIILITFLLSQSSTGYFALFISIGLVFSNSISFKKIFVAGFVLSVTLYSLVNFVPKFQSRFITIISLITGKIYVDATYGENAAGSSLILFNHFLIANQNAKDHPFGTGMGSHHLAFERYNFLKTWFTGYGPDSVVLNVHDASSLFNRILSEMGYIGIVAMFFFLVKFFLKNGYYEFVIINNASLVVLFTALLRSGHYFICGLPFFFLCYYYSKVLSERYNSSNNDLLI